MSTWMNGLGESWGGRRGAAAEGVEDVAVRPEALAWEARKDARDCVARWQRRGHPGEFLASAAPVRLGLWRLAAEEGVAEAQWLLALAHDAGAGVAADASQAVLWHQQAARQGFAPAQNSLGICYFKGIGVEQDFEEAAGWFRKAAKQGDSSGQNNLGCCYLTGRGAPRDPARALSWFVKSAEQGDVSGQFSLGHCLQRGLGTSASLGKARGWFEKAARRGFGPAVARLSELERGPRMTPPPSSLAQGRAG